MACAGATRQRRLGQIGRALCQTRCLAAPRALGAAAGPWRAFLAAGHAGRLRHGRPGPVALRARRLPTGRHWHGQRRALHGGGDRLGHRCRRLDRSGQPKAHALPRHGVAKQVALRAPGRVGGLQSAQVQSGEIHPWRRYVLQPGAPVCGGPAGAHRGARLVYRWRRVHARPVGLRDHGSRPGQSLFGRAAFAQGRHGRDCH